MLAIRCRFINGVFEASSTRNPALAEWPPSPMRLFSALVSVAEPDSDDDVILRLMESSTPPTIWASPALRSRREAFVPTNRVESETKHTVLVGRTNSARSWARAIPRQTEVVFEWPDLSLSPEHCSRLDRLCRRVPYLGRSTSPAVLDLIDQVPQDLERLDPLPLNGIEAGVLRAPFDGALGALRDVYQRRHIDRSGGDSWAVGVDTSYGLRAVSPSSVATPSPFEDLVIFKLGGRRIDAMSTLAVTSYVRSALIKLSDQGGGAEPALHGHVADGLPHVGVLGLPDVRLPGIENPNAGGHLLGVAVAIPELEEGSPRLARALRMLERVEAGPLGILSLEWLSPLDALMESTAGLRSERWTRTARRWMSALPVVLDRYPKGATTVERAVEISFEHAGYPTPRVVRASKYPLIAGSPGLSPRHTKRSREARMRPYRYVDVEFADPQHGPVVAGAMRYFGLGLFVPVPGRTAMEDGDE